MSSASTFGSKRRGEPLEALRRLMNREPARRGEEVCEMCARPIPPAHAHVVNTETRSLLCACRYCYLLFTREGAGNGKYRAVPERYRYDPGFALSESQWESLQMPVRIAFFFHNSSLRKVVAFYPSPAGATESLLDLGAWRSLVEENRILEGLEPDVEALLVYGRRDGAFQCFVVPIDACYELTGRVKRSWRGFDGGEEVWKEIEDYFTALRARSRNLRD
jgi:uncharacterized protein DUF5947